MNRRIVKAFHNTALLRRDAIFGSDALMPITATDDAKTSAPGWVGAQWAQGTLLVGINPGGGGDNYRRNSSDDELYKLLRAFRDAESSESQQLAFALEWIRLPRPKICSVLGIAWHFDKSRHWDLAASFHLERRHGTSWLDAICQPSLDSFFSSEESATAIFPKTLRRYFGRWPESENSL